MDLCRDLEGGFIRISVHLWMGSTMYPIGGHYIGILFEGIWLLLEDKQFSSREDCNVPTLGHHHSAEVYDDQSSQRGVI
jgi:hypothetical protein